MTFFSGATNLVPDDTNDNPDVFVHDLQSGKTTRVSEHLGFQGNGNSQYPSISADGRFVTFYSSSSNWVPGDTSGIDVFVHNRKAGTTTLVSVTPAEDEGNGPSFNPSISADGRFIAFYSFASDLAPGDTNNVEDVFVRDRKTGKTTRVSLRSNGDQGTCRVSNPRSPPTVASWRSIRSPRT